MTFFTSDLHFGHANIIKFCNRPFLSVDHMNQELIKNINSTVGLDDTLYILGDLAFMQESEIIKILNQINCKNLHFIDGNHDKKIRNDSGIKRYFKSYDVYKEINVNGQHIILFHFPLLEWNAGHRGAWMLHGHTHGTLVLPERLQDKKIVDVGVDVWDMKPVSFNDLTIYMHDKKNIIYGEG